MKNISLMTKKAALLRILTVEVAPRNLWPDFYTRVPYSYIHTTLLIAGLVGQMPKSKIIEIPDILYLGREEIIKDEL
jgi:hypothetical protein